MARTAARTPQKAKALLREAIQKRAVVLLEEGGDWLYSYDGRGRRVGGGRWRQTLAFTRAGDDPSVDLTGR